MNLTLKKLLRLNRIKHGYCNICLKNMAREGYKSCVECFNKSKYRKEQLLNSRLCTKCLKNKPIYGKKCETCYDKHIEKSRKLKIEIMNQYGGVRCECCGESNIGFLTIDHKYDDGIKDRISNFYRHLKKNGFPDKDRLRVLCYNCNMGREKTDNKFCPHKVNKIHLFYYGDGI